MINELQPEGLCFLWNGPWQANCIPIHDCVHWSPPPSSDPAWHKHKSFYQRQFLTSVWSFEKDNLKISFPQILSWGASHFLKREGINHGSPSMTESPPAYPLNLKPTFINLQINTPRANSKSSFSFTFFLNPTSAFLQCREQLSLSGDTYLSSPFLVSICLGLFSIRGSFDCVSPLLSQSVALPRIIAAFPIEPTSQRKNVCQTSVNSCSIQTWPQWLRLFDYLICLKSRAPK